MGKIVYLGHYCHDCSERSVSLAAVAVMEYVIGCINRLGYDLTVLSPAQLSGRKTCGCEVRQINEKTTCIYTPTPKKADRWNYLYRGIQKLRREWDLRKELENLVEDGDTLLVYHSLALMDAVRWIRGRRKVHLVLQVCEIYSDAVENISEKKRNAEIAYIKEADRYVFMSDTLAQTVNAGKTYAVCLGACTVRAGNEKTRGEKIHVVYAGTLDPVKGGARNAVSAGEFLSGKYHLHILGIGSTQQLAELEEQIRDVSRKTKATITYDGVLSGDAYSAFLHQCDIGLSTQNADKAFNATSFPSKILSYMSHGLYVVSARMPLIETSGVGDYLSYYDVQKPEKIAQAIMKVDISSPYDAAALVEKLDKDFCRSLGQIIDWEAVN